VKRWFVTAVLVAACGDGGGPGAPPDYALLLSPTSLNVNQGTSPNVAVSISRSNFVGGVAMFVTGAPANVTGTVVPGTTNGSTATLTVVVGASTTPGTYNLVVNGNGAPGARTTILPLTVTVAPNYTLELTPGALSIARGSSDSTQLTITRTNFAGAVTLSLIGAPTGVTSSFVPSTPTNNSSILTITVAAGATPGLYALSVQGTTTIGDRSAGLTLTVLP
jgi:uncharacterized membrane protein